MVDVAEDLIEATDRDEKKHDIIDGVRIRHEKSVPAKFMCPFSPKNDAEQKERFLRRKFTPQFALSSPIFDLENWLLRQNGKIHFNLFCEAKRILGIVIKRFKTIDNFVEASYGPMISVEKATEKVMNYSKTSGFPTPLEVIWCDDLIGRSALPYQASDRHFTVLLRSNSGNTYLREQGILSLLDHELGTHYLRSYNDGTQAWYMKRKEFELTASNSSELMTIEEGLACLHTAFHGRYPYLGIPALLYYGACMAEYLPFKDLYQHLSKYVKNEEQLWKHCMRVKRCLPCQNDCGGYGKDQRYFEGAVAILREQNNIDFAQLMCGKLAISDLPKIKEVCSAERIHLPYFMKPMAAYRARLLQIARLNGVTVMEANAAPPSLCFGKTSKTSHMDSASRSFQDSRNARLKKCTKVKIHTHEHMREARNLTDRRNRSTSLRSRYPINSRPAAPHPAFEPSLASDSPHIEFPPSVTSFFESLEYVDITPVSVVQRESLREHSNVFKNLAVGDCGCSLFTKGYISAAPSENSPFQAIPIVIEIDMRHPILDANL